MATTGQPAPRTDARLGVAALFRYPVKSMLGEELGSCAVGPKGLLGDRAYALLDPADGTIATAKNPKKWGRLLELRASFVEEPESDESLPPVVIRFADGSTCRSDDVDVESRLAATLGRPVRLVQAQDVKRELEIVWADIDGLNPRERVEATAIGSQDGEVLGKARSG